MSSGNISRDHGLELWSGVECTVNRVGNDYFDQLERSGHSVRLSDIDRLADLGIAKVRYPLLWERMAPTSLRSIDWSWADERLERLRKRNLTPIVGLVHHGSGPRYTNLLDPSFPEKLAEYAAAVAARYPWVNLYTPINEPLTTARFSCLYGHWYPHATDPLLFARAVVNQMRAIVLAMQAIRKFNPDA
ncbi:MAG TPA: family 1 glycosylhydrolase, partial [Pyrinomonadaceae bacterium]